MEKVIPFDRAIVEIFAGKRVRREYLTNQDLKEYISLDSNYRMIITLSYTDETGDHEGYMGVWHISPVDLALNYYLEDTSY